jgi:hypothetical protein
MKKDLITLLEQPKAIIVEKGKVEFPIYEEVRETAVELAQAIESVEVTEKNAKASKDLVASVRGKVNELNSQRIAIKKDMLEPYTKFEKQVKEISDIVGGAEETVRKQLRELDEQARDLKRMKLEFIYGKRVVMYPLTQDLLSFEHFLQPTYLNKSVTETKCENAMVEWLERVEEELKNLMALENGVECVAEYQNCQDFAKAMKTVRERKEKEQALKKAEIAKKAKAATADEFSVTITGKKEFEFFKLWAKENGIQFKEL